MCTGKCSRFVGFALLPLGFLCIIANILLIFPDGQTKYTDHITLQVWLMGGILGGGIMVMGPSCAAIRAGGKGCCGEGCCGNRCRMFRSIISSLFGALGSFYCVVVAGIGLNDGPLCNIGTIEEPRWRYYLKGLNTTYLTNQTSWNECVEPKNIVLWNITLFSILLGLGCLEFGLCAVQVVNALFGVMCGDCRKKEKVNSGGNTSANTGPY
uniref:Transmembrane 4 L six family member 5 n=1 Tax=Leptobrachium leishanense TaxID=445787 RepID=A0A8C5PAG0_9ANUR